MRCCGSHSLVAREAECERLARRWYATSCACMKRFQPSEDDEARAARRWPWLASTAGNPACCGERTSRLRAALTHRLPVVAVIARQPDLGRALWSPPRVSMSCFLPALMLASARRRRRACSPEACVLLWEICLHDYQRKRILTTRDTRRIRWGAGYTSSRVERSTGLWAHTGKGWRTARQASPRIHPERHTGLSFAVDSE